ncbi:uncharacterized [Tachysurus ichikawai]
MGSAGSETKPPIAMNHERLHTKHSVNPPVLLIKHLIHLSQASDKQRLLKEVFHKQILPAELWLKRAFLSPSSGTQPIELQPSEACIEAGYGPALHPSGPGHPHTVPGHLCPPTPSVGTLLTQPCYLVLLGHNALKSSLFRSL